MSTFEIRRLESKVIVQNNMLQDSLHLKVAELETKINEGKANSYYKYTVTGECDGIFDDNDDKLLNLSYGSGSSTVNNFSLYISHACIIHKMTFMSVFGANEVSNPEVKLTIKIIKHPENVEVVTFPFPNNNYTGFTSEDMSINIPLGGCFLYVYASSSNLTDVTNRHRLSFEFKTNLF